MYVTGTCGHSTYVRNGPGTNVAVKCREREKNDAACVFVAAVGAQPIARGKQPSTAQVMPPGA